MTTKKNYYPVVILMLVAALVAVAWLLVIERARSDKELKVVQAGSTGNDGKPVPTISWKLVTSWPKNLPGLGTAPEHFAEAIDRMSNGRLKIRVYGAGEIVPAMEVFNAVSLGTAEMGHSAAYYWKGKIPASPFFTSVPFGMTAQEQNAWLHYGGGLELWREAYAPFNIIPFAGGNTGVQMAGWFNKEINSLEDIKGLLMRIPGVGGEVFNRAGGTAITLAGGEIYTSLQTGVIDATEWVAPYNDLSMGLQEVAEYYYYPGWHEPGPNLEILVNKDAFASLPADLQAIVEIAARYANQDMLDEYTARNNSSLVNLQNNHNTKLRKLPDDVLRQFKQSSEDYLADLIAEDEFAAKVYKNWKPFVEGVKNYHHISEQSYINARDL